MKDINEKIFILLKSAINDGTRDELMDLLCETADEQYLDYVINKVAESIQEFLPMIPEIQPKISSILNVIIGLAEIAVFGLEKSLCLTRCLINIAADVNCSIYNLKQVLTMLKTFSQDERMVEYISKDESLIAPLKLVGKRLPEIGDYECQLSLLDVLWQLSSLNRDFCGRWWFDDENQRSMFLDLNNDQFEVGCRQFLNYVNETQNENRRTLSFIASSVYLGSIQLKEPFKSEFWIDINLDTQSISFFFSSLVLENENTWETIIISSDMVEGYTMKDVEDKAYNEDKSIELCITLRFSCSQLRESEGNSIAGLESNLVRINFENLNEHSDIPSYIETIFQRNDAESQAVSVSRKVSDCAEVISQCSDEVSALKKQRRASQSTDLVCFSAHDDASSALKQSKQKRRASQSTDLVCASYQDEPIATKYCKQKRRASQSTDLVCVTDQQEEAESQIYKRRRRVSDSAELVYISNSENKVVNAIETINDVPDNDRKVRKYKHRKKVSDGFVDSEEFNQVLDDVNNNEEEAQNIVNTLDSRNKQNAMHDQKFSIIYDSESENDAKSCTNDDQNNLSPLMIHNKESIEIYSPNKSLQKNNSVEQYINEVSHDKNYVEEGFLKKKVNSIDEFSSHNLQLLSVPYGTQRKSSQPVENINSRKKTLNEHPRSEPKTSQNSNLLTIPDITRRKSSQHSPEIVEIDKQVLSNMSPERFKNGAISPKEKEKDPVFESETEENQFNAETQYDTYQLPSKKFKKGNDRKTEYQVSRENSVGSLQAAQYASTSNTEMQKGKKCRKSAVTARKRNKLIFAQKGSETSFEENQLGNKQTKDSGFSQETDEYDVFALPSSMEKEIFPRKRSVFESDEDVSQGNARSAKRKKSTRKGYKSMLENDDYAYCVTPPNVKRRNRSVFVTDTETGSSEVSWLHKQPKLFETPQKFYTNRKKKMKEALQKTRRSKSKLKKAKTIPNTKQKFSQRSKASDSETRSKSALSELDNFNLVVEKNPYYKPMLSRDLPGLYHTLKSDRNVKQPNPIESTQDYPFNNYDELNANEKSFDIDGDPEFLPEVSVTPEGYGNLRTSVKPKNISDRPSTAAETSNVRIQRNSPQNKNTKFVDCLIVDEDDLLPKGSTKRKRTDTNSFMEPNSKRNKSFIDIDYTNLDTITCTEEEFNELKTGLHNGTRKITTKPIAKQSKSNKAPDNIGMNLPILSETENEVSLFDIKGGNVSERKATSNNSLETQNKRLPLKHKNALTEESLDLYNDEEMGKRMHLDRFFESLSSASTNPQDLGISDLSPTVKKSKSKLAKEKIREENSLYEECCLSNQLKPSPEKSNMDFQIGKEQKAANSSLLNEDAPQIAEENYNKDVSIGDPFECPLFTSTPLLHKEASNGNLSGEDLLMNPSVLHILSDEVNNLTYKLFSTLKRCMTDFREKMAALRESIVNTADNMISNESKFTEKDLQALVQNCRESRIHIQRNLKKLYALGIEYFESEKRHERRLAKKHRKAVLKYTKSLQLAKAIAEKALEERFVSKSKAFFKTFLKQMKLV